MATVPADLSAYAGQASALTGLDSNVILAQWISENGWKVPAGYNFGNIMVPGTHTLQTYSSGPAGVAAYANFLKSNSNYKGVLAAANGSPQTQLNAIVSSPWDAGHYGGNGSLLYNVYDSVTGATLGPATSDATTAATGSPAAGVPNQLQALQGVAQGTGSGWFAGAQSIGLMIMLAGLGLIVLFVGLKLISGGGGTSIIEGVEK